MSIKTDSVAKLQKLLAKTQDLLHSSADSLELDRWRRNALIAISEMFGNSSDNHTNFYRIQFDTSWRADLDDEAVNALRREAYSKGMEEAQELLRSMIFEIEEYWEEVPINVGAEAERDVGDTSESIKQYVFIGHGRSPLWARLQTFLEGDLHLRTITYESEVRAGESIVPILEEMLNKADFAVLILTAEDDTARGRRRARQNVIHEAGLFQGKLGFKKAILLVQEGVEDFSNVAGLQYISFSAERIEQTFWELQRVLKKQGLIQ